MVWISWAKSNKDQRPRLKLPNARSIAVLAKNSAVSSFLTSIKVQPITVIPKGKDNVFKPNQPPWERISVLNLTGVERSEKILCVVCKKNSNKKGTNISTSPYSYVYT